MAPSILVERKAPEGHQQPEGHRRSQIPDSQEIDFVSLGMLIIDEIEFHPPRPPARDVLGGAGTFSALGARLFSPAPDQSRKVGFVVDRGSDFPAEITAQIASWQTSALIRDDPSRLTTRGWNGYDCPTDPSWRSFRYTTPKKRLTPADLSSCEPLLRAQVVHVISSPQRCREVVRDLASLRRRIMGDDDYVRAVIVWEPVPDLCTPDNLLECTNTLPLVDVCSPNHAELAGFMGGSGVDEKGEVDVSAVERGCEQLLASMPLQSFSIVVRAGAKGCYVARNGGRKKRRGSNNATSNEQHEQPKKKKKTKAKAAALLHGGLQPDTDMEALFAGLLQDEEGSVAREEIEVDPGVEKWLPAFFTPASSSPSSSSSSQDGVLAAEGDDDKNDKDNQDKIVDPTGGGNTFLGGLAVALARGKDVEEAAVWGSVAASFALEQVGLPTLAVDEDGNETWNGVRVEERLADYVKRVG